MSRLNHPNVLRFFGLVVEGPMVVGIMTEFAAAGSLASYLRSGVGFIPLRQRAQLALHAVNGMAYLHSLKVRAWLGRGRELGGARRAERCARAAPACVPPRLRRSLALPPHRPPCLHPTLCCRPAGGPL